MLNDYDINRPVDLLIEDYRRSEEFKELADPEIINGVRMFSTRELCRGYDGIFGDNTNYCSEFFDKYSNSIKYVPGKYYPIQKLITGCLINKVNRLASHVGTNWKPAETYASKNGKTLIPNQGGTIAFKIKGENSPMFTISIKDSSGYDILDEEIKNVIVDNEEYILEQKIPALAPGRAFETFTYELTPSADTSYYYNSNYVNAGTITGKIWQFKNPKFTFNASDSSISNSTTTQTAITIRGATNSRSATIPGTDSPYYSDSTHTTTIARSSGTDKYYVKTRKLLLSDVITKSNVIKMKVTNTTNLGGLTDSPCQTFFQVVESPYFESDSYRTRIYNGDLEIGMNFWGKVERTSTIRKSIDLIIHKEPLVKEDELKGILTNRFEIDSAKDLTVGMQIIGKDFKSVVESIDDKKTITLSSKHIVEKNSEVTFIYSVSGNVIGINKNTIETDTCAKIPNNTELVFEKANKSSVKGRIACSKSGDTSTVITTTITDGEFGQDDVTFTLDPDLFITNKPNAYDQDVIAGIKTDLWINFIQTDCDWNAVEKTLAITKNPTSGVLSLKEGFNYYQKYTPNDNFRGKDSIKFTMSDGVNTSEEKTIYITVK